MDRVQLTTINPKAECSMIGFKRPQSNFQGNFIIYKKRAIISIIIKAAKHLVVLCFINSPKILLELYCVFNDEIILTEMGATMVINPIM
jgi:hypothetical protein